jgi:hypothetical protein
MRSSFDRRDGVVVTALALIGVGVPLWLAASAGAIGIPTVDDWVYIRGALSLFNTGAIDMPGHTAAAVGQLVMVQPFLWLSRGDPWAFTAFGLTMTLFGIVATYLLARRFLTVGSASLVVLLVEAFPGFTRISASFMTDIPAYALGVVCLLTGAMWLDRGRRAALLGCLGVGVLAVSIREFAIAAPLAVLAVSWARSAPKERLWLAGASVTLAVGVAGVIFAASLIPGHAVPQISGGPGRIVLALPAVVTFAAVLLPVLILAIARQIQALRPAQLLAGVGIAGLAFIAPWGIWTGGGGNFWTPFGLAGDGLLRGTRDPVIGPTAWAMSSQLAWTAEMLLATLVISWLQRDLGGANSLSTARTKLLAMASHPNALLGAFLGIYAGGLIAFSAVYGIWDRYLYPVVPAGAIVISNYGPATIRFGKALAFSHAALIWLGISAAVIATNSFAYDAARWRQGEAAVAIGYDAQSIDAGYEWVGYYASGSGGQGTGDRGQAWFEYLMAPAQLCAVISNSSPGSDEPLLDEGLTPLDRNFVLLRATPAAYRQFLFFGKEQPLYLYGALEAGCPNALPR